MTILEQAQPGFPKLVRCPTCSGDSVYAASNPYRPFCSTRCKDIDLGAWANEDFRMPAKIAPEDQLTNDEQ
jgi:endogenous inhibitor of DNA gyrase (YacG/DUF329 family)